MKIYLAVFLVAAAQSGGLMGATIILNQGFEEDVLAPWFQDRSFGNYRSWTVGSTVVQDGSKSAFCLGRIELRQNFVSELGSNIMELSFYGWHQLANKGNPWVELFYQDGTTSGQLEIRLNPAHSFEVSHQMIWDKFDLTPYINPNLNLNGISFVGVPGNTFSIDSVVLNTIPESSSFVLMMGSLALLMRRQRTVQQAMDANLPLAHQPSTTLTAMMR
jgi:hypothetical protein